MSGSKLRLVVSYVTFGLGALAAFLASAPWMRGYLPGALTAHLAVASVVGVAIPVVVATVLRRSFFVSAGASVVAGLLYVLVAVVGEPAGLGTIARGFANGVSQLLSNTLPLTAAPSLQVLPVVACWIVAAAIGEVLGRGRSVAVPVLVALVSFGGAYAATSGGVSDDVSWSTALFVALGALVFLRRWLLDADAVTFDEVGAGTDVAVAARAVRYRPLAYGAAAVAVVAIVSGVAVPRLAALQEPPAKPDRKAPEEQPEHIAPLADVAELRRDAVNRSNDVVFSMEVEGTVPAYVTLAELDAYDGDTWRLDNVFVPTGGRVPDPPGAAGVSSRDVRQSYEIVGGLPGSGAWMPFVSRPREVSGLDVRYAAVNGMVMPVASLPAAARYSVVSAVAPESGGDLVRLLRNGTTAKIDRTSRANTVVPGDIQSDLQSWLDDLAKPTGARAEPTIEFLATMASEFESSYFRTEESRALVRAAASSTTTSTSTTSTTTTEAPTTETSEGETTTTSEGETTTTTAEAVGTTLVAALERPNAGGTAFAEVSAAIGVGRSGTPEQYATLYALLARKLGVPARVVTGFRLPDSDASRTVAAGRYDVKGSQAWTWVEVATKELGWVVVDPTPSRTSVDATKDVKSIEATDQSSTTSTVPLAAAGTILKPVNTEATRVVGRQVGESSFPVLPVALVVLLVLVLSFVPVYRLARRAKRQRGSPTEQAIGAWHETLDVLDAARLRPLSSLTGTQVVAVTAERFGVDAGQSVGVIAGVANQALYFPLGVRADDADRAWSALAELRAKVGKAQGVAKRAGAALRLGRGVRPHA